MVVVCTKAFQNPGANVKYVSIVVAVLSGPGGATLRTFDALTGGLVIEKRLHEPALGKLFEPADLGSQIAFPSKADGPSKDDAYILTDGHALRSIDCLTGQLKWQWLSEDQGYVN